MHGPPSVGSFSPYKEPTKEPSFLCVGSFVGSNDIACDGSRQHLGKNQHIDTPNSKAFKRDYRGFSAPFFVID